MLKERYEPTRIALYTLICQIHFTHLACTDIKGIQRSSSQSCSFRCLKNKILDCLCISDMLNHKNRIGCVAGMTLDGAKLKYSLNQCYRQNHILYLVHIAVILYSLNQSAVNCN